MAQRVGIDSFRAGGNNISSREPITGSDSLSEETNRYGSAVERADGLDFPFYNNIPHRLAIWQWILVILACAGGFFVLSLYPAANNVQRLVPRFLFAAIPLGVFIAFTRGHWSLIMRRVHGRDIRAMLLFGIANIVLSFIVGLIVKTIFGTAANGAITGVQGAGEVITFYVGTAIQLFGEELFTILPFLAVMSFCVRGGLGRKQAILIAWLVTAAWFGAAHLPTYDWHIAQAFLTIGIARLVLTLAYIRTKNILVSTGAHVLNDWVLFTVAIVTMR